MSHTRRSEPAQGRSIPKRLEYISSGVSNWGKRWQVNKTSPYDPNPHSHSRLPPRKTPQRRHRSITPPNALAQPATFDVTPPPTPPTDVRGGVDPSAISHPGPSSRPATLSPETSSSALIPNSGACSTVIGTFVTVFPANPTLGSDGDLRPSSMSLHQRTQPSIRANYSSSSSSDQQALATFYNMDYITPASSPERAVGQLPYGVQEQDRYPSRVVNYVPVSSYGQTFQSTGWPSMVAQDAGKLHCSIASNVNGTNPPSLPLIPVPASAISSKSFVTPIDYDMIHTRAYSKQNPSLQNVYISSHGGRSIPARYAERPIPRLSRPRVPANALQQCSC